MEGVELRQHSSFKSFLPRFHELGLSEIVDIGVLYEKLSAFSPTDPTCFRFLGSRLRGSIGLGLAERKPCHRLASRTIASVSLDESVHLLRMTCIRELELVELSPSDMLPSGVLFKRRNSRLLVEVQTACTVQG